MTGLFLVVGTSLSAQPLSEEKNNLVQARQHYLQQKAALPPGDIDRRLELGYFCSENGLYREAVQEFRVLLNAPGLSLKSKQNVARLIDTVEENAAITLYNEALLVWQQDQNLDSSRRLFEELLNSYPTAKIVTQAKTKIAELEDEIALKTQLAAAAKKLARAATENFVVYSPQKDLSATLAQQAEGNRKRIIEAFGFSIFPSWRNNPAEVVIFSSREDFLRYARAAEWSGGWSSQVLTQAPDGTKEIMERRIFTFAAVPNLRDSVLAHEVTHLVFREFFGFSPNLPQWLDEGVAVWQETAPHPELVPWLQGALLAQKAIPFAQFLFLKNYPPEPSLYYAQAVSLTQFLVTGYGSKKFVEFAKALSLNEPLAKALVLAYHDEFLDLDDLEQTWKMHLQRQK